MVDADTFWFYRKSLRTQFMRSEYGRVFTLGCLLLIVCIAIVGFMAYHNHPEWQSIFTMSVAHMVAGKGVSVIQGLTLGLHPLIILALATLSDVILMLIAYPILVFTYEHFIQSPLFQHHMRPVFDSARKRADRIGRFKVLAVFMFVWLPLWMTGVLVGSILGYLLGLRPWTTLVAAALGTFTSSLAWLLFSNQIMSAVGWVNDRVVGTGVFVLLLGLLAWRIWRRRQLAHSQAADLSSSAAREV